MPCNPLHDTGCRVKWTAIANRATGRLKAERRTPESGIYFARVGSISGLKANADYALSFWMRMAPDTQGLIVLDTDDVYDRTCQWVRNGGQPTEWTRYRGIFNSGVVDSDKKTPNSGTLTLRIRASDLVGSVYLDDISLIEVGGGGGGGDRSFQCLEVRLPRFGKPRVPRFPL